METKLIRTLTADEIDVRVAQTTNYNGVVKVNLLLYKDARVDMKILDELYGPMGWKRTHQLIGDRLYCTIEVRDPATGDWIAKQDVGTESNTEPEKGQASDAFKRAGFNWGIGRELYTAPKIQVTLNKDEYRDNGGRIQVWAAFYVARIAYDEDRNISDIVVRDRTGTERFSMKPTRKTTSKKPSAPVPSAPADPAVQPDPEPLYVSGLTATQYWSLVRRHASGEKSKSGGDLRAAWIQAATPRPEEIDRFDLDVQDYKAARQDGAIQ